MMMMKNKRVSLVFALLLVLNVSSSMVFAHEDHEAGLMIGRSGANQVKFELGHPGQTIRLEPTVFHDGWAGEFCVEALSVNESDEDMYKLGGESSIVLKVLDIDPEFYVGLMSGGPLFNKAGDLISLGGENLHTHLLWYISNSVLGETWTGTRQVTLQLIDEGSTNYLPSDAFTLTFTNVPEPVTLTLLTTAGLIGLSRRRFKL